MKKLTLNPKFEILKNEKKRLNEMLPLIKVASPSCFSGFVPLRPLTEVRQRQKLILRLSGEQFSDVQEKANYSVIKVKKLTVGRVRFTSTQRKNFQKSTKSSNTTQTESPDKENQN